MAGTAFGQSTAANGRWIFAQPAVEMATVEVEAATSGSVARAKAASAPHTWRFDRRRVASLTEAVTATERALNADVAATAAVSLDIVATREGSNGYVHHRYRELGPGGHPVLGGGLVIHQRPDRSLRREVLSATGTVFAAERFDEDATSSLNVAAARRIAEEASGGNGGFRASDALDATALYWAPADLDFDAGTFRLCYRVDVYALSPARREYVFVDASTGAIIGRYPRLHSAAGPLSGGHDHGSHTASSCTDAGTEVAGTEAAGTEAAGTAETMYSGTRAITTERTSAGAYRLYQEDARDLVIHTLDARNYVLDVSTAQDVVDADNDWTGDGIAAKQPARDVFWASSAYADFMREHFGWNSMDDAGHALVGYVHVGTEYGNAFWDGEASYYGDGEPFSKIATPLVTVDVVGHEFSHGFVEFTAGLIYQYESGALNESFADIFGQGLRAETHPDRADDYSIGADVDPDAVGFRSMSEPNLHEHPDTYDGNYYYIGDFDNGGVHTNSGIQNYWYYLLVEGGSGVNDRGDAYEVSAISREDALSLAHATVANYLTASSDYADAAAASVLAARELFGDCDARTRSVAAAWRAVGLAVDGVDGLALNASETQVCTPGTPTVLTAANQTDGVVTWDLGDGSVASGDTVVHTYPEGRYEVSATAVGCGGDTIAARLASPVTVDPNALACFAYDLPRDGSTDSVSTCGGVISDGSGTDSYDNDWEGSLIVRHPAGTGGYTITVEEFDTEPGFDYVTVSSLENDGTRAQIGIYSGRTLAAGDTIAVLAPGFVVEFNSDGSVTGPGFSFAFEAIGGDATAVAGFEASPSPGVLVPVTFARAAAAVGAVSYDLGDGGYVENAPDTLAYAYAAPGTYTVTQYATTCTSSDTATVAITVSPGSSVCAAVDTTYLTLERNAAATFEVELENCGPRELQLASGRSTLQPRQRSFKPYTDSFGSYTSHAFYPLDVTEEELSDVELVIRYSGDFDEADEYLWVYSDFGEVSFADDGNPENGALIERRIVIPRSYYSSLIEYGLDVECANTYAVGAGEGGSDAHEVILQYKIGVAVTEVAFSQSPPLPAGATTTATVTVSAAGLAAGVYTYDESIQTNDTSLVGGALALPVVLTVPSSAVGRFSPDTLDLGSLYEGFERDAGVRLYNDGEDPLRVDSVHSNGTLITWTSFENATIVPPGSNQFHYLTIRPETIGRAIRDTLSLFYGAGQVVRLPIRADVEGAPLLRLGASTQTDSAVDTVYLTGGNYADSVYLHNEGSSSLLATVSLSDYDLRAITMAPSGEVAVAPGDSLLLRVSAPASALDGFQSFDFEVYAYTNSPPYLSDRHSFYVPAIVRAPSPTITTPPTSCGARVTFEAREASASVTYAWAFGDGAVASTERPTHVYSADGTYEVVVETCNELGCASDTLSLAVQTGCSSIVMDDFDSSATGCRMRIYDAGGPDDEIRGSSTRSLAVNSGTGAPLLLTIREFEVSTWSSLKVYDGNSDSAPLLADWSGQEAAGTTIQSGVNGLFLVYESTTYYGGEGYVLDVECVGGERLVIGGAPQADCPAVYEFGAYAPKADTWRWSFGDGRGTLSQNPTHVYTSPGRYPVIVYASGEDGWADTTAMLAVVGAGGEVISIEMIGDATVASPKTFAVSGAPASAVVRWTSSEGHDLTGALVQMTFENAGVHYVDAHANPVGGCRARATRNFTLEGASAIGATRAETSLELYPNPATAATSVRLRGWDGSERANLMITDALGRVVRRITLTSARTEVSVSELPAGAYTVAVRLADGTHVTRVLIVE